MHDSRIAFNPVGLSLFGGAELAGRAGVESAPVGRPLAEIVQPRRHALRFKTELSVQPFEVGFCEG